MARCCQQPKSTSTAILRTTGALLQKIQFGTARDRASFNPETERSNEIRQKKLIDLTALALKIIKPVLLKSAELRDRQAARKSLTHRLGLEPFKVNQRDTAYKNTSSNCSS